MISLPLLSFIDILVRMMILGQLLLLAPLLLREPASTVRNLLFAAGLSVAGLVLLTAQELSNGEINKQSYALTWRWNEKGRYAHHGGVSKGSMAWLAVYPDHALVIAMATNTKLAEFSDFAAIQTPIVELFANRQRH